MTSNAKPELLAPAGSFEKLKMAIEYGADAVYLGGKDYGLRAFASNFDTREMQEGIEYAHKRGKRVYVTVNIIPHNEDLIGLAGYLEKLYDLGIDAVIVSDPGVISIAREKVPGLELHLSTQANCTNWRSALSWKEIGVDRIIIARELNVQEIEEVIKNSGVKIESFVHGAMCISYSGRCLLSGYMIDRHANRGTCAHPCRWKYHLMEEERPGEYFPIEEDERGTYILSSKDLCLLEHIPRLIDAGISAFKIEGRMRSVHYVGTVTKAYRIAIDKHFEENSNYPSDEELMEEVKKASTRPFTTGFYFGKPDENDQIYSDKYKENLNKHKFVGLVRGSKKLNSKNHLVIEQRNYFEIGDMLEIVEPDNYAGKIKVEDIINSQGDSVDRAPHPQEIVMIPADLSIKENSLVRRLD